MSINKNLGPLKNILAALAVVAGTLCIPAMATGQVYADAFVTQPPTPASSTSSGSLAEDAKCAAGEKGCVCPSGTTDPACVDPATKSGDLDCNGDGTTDANCNLVTKYVNPLIKLLSGLAGVAVVIGIIVGGIEYASSAGDPQKVSKAKTHIRNSIIALLVFFFLWAGLTFLLPGGLITG